MELREGMYIRSKDKRGNQFVRRIVELPNVPVYGSIVVDKDIHNVKWVSKKNVLKASNSIIDLIETGDYVNGYRVYSGGENHFDYILTWDEERDYYMKIELPSVDIKSIVTKEQFDSMKYEVE